jgi:uncharacterized protein YecE (DUF72 family)
MRQYSRKAGGAVIPAAAMPAGLESLAYHRLHGSPDIYHSEYSEMDLTALAAKLCGSSAHQVWCIFDDIARQPATLNG